MKTKVVHSPLPWKFRVAEYRKRESQLVQQTEMFLETTEAKEIPLAEPVILAVRQDWTWYLLNSEEGKANAAFLLRAVNSHEELVALLREVSNRPFVPMLNGGKKPVRGKLLVEREMFNRLEAALARAQGKE